MKLHYLAGFASRDHYLKNSPGFSSVVSYINQHVSSEGRVLMLFEARGFYFEVPIIQDNLFSNWILLAGKLSSLNCLKGSGISHVLFNGTALDYFFRRGLDPKFLHLEEFQQFAEECLTAVYQSNKHVIYRLGNMYAREAFPRFYDPAPATGSAGFRIEEPQKTRTAGDR